MKFIFFTLLACLPFSVFAQVPDTTQIGREVDSLSDTAVKLYKASKFEEALVCLDSAFSLADRFLDRESKRYTNLLIRKGRCYYMWVKYDAAEPFYLETKRIYEKKNQVNTEEYCFILNHLAFLYSRIGDYAKSELLFLEVIKIRAQIVGKGHANYAGSLNNLAAIYHTKSDYSKAEPLYFEAKEIQIKTLGRESPDYAGSLNNLATLYRDKGDYTKAEELFLEAKEIRAKSLDRDPRYYTQSLNNLANLYNDKGAYDKAEPLFLEAKEIRSQIMGREHPEYSESLNGLANLFYDKGDYSKAEDLYLEEKEILAKTLGKEHPDYAMTLNNLANLYLKKGDYSKVEPLHLEAIEIRAKTLGREHPDYAQSLQNLALFYSDQGDYSKAEQFYVKAKEIRAQAQGREHPDYAMSLNNLANLYFKKGDYAKVEPLHLEAIEIRTKMLGKEHPHYASSLNNLANLYRAIGDHAKAEPLYLELNTILYAFLQKAATYNSEREMLLFSTTFQNKQENILSFTLSHPTDTLLATVYDNALTQTNTLLDAAITREKSIVHADRSTQAIYAEWKSCHFQLNKWYGKPKNERDSAIIADLEARAEQYEKELVRRSPDFVESRREMHWRKVRARLKLGEAAITFLHFRWNNTKKTTDSTLYAALVLLPFDTTHHFIPLFEERQLQALLNRPGLSEKLVIKDLYGNSPELRRLLWDPIEPLLRDVKTIYYSPSGLLHRLNPAALLDESNQTLSEGRQWVRVGSTRELVTGRLADRSFARVPEANADNALTAMVYGGITYDMDSLAFATANPINDVDSTENPLRKDGAFSYIVTEEPNTKTSGTRGNPDGTWGALAATGQEADQVSTMLANAGFSTLKQKGFSASEEQFKQIGVGTPSPRILHMATHGFSYPDPKKDPPKGFGESEPTYKMLDDPMLRSGLVLAGANYYWKNKRPLANREDGVLVAYEVRDLNLRNTELAVLSACQTGLGDVVGSEGVYGLQRAFRIAGAKFLIVSLWEVPDEQTQELMRLFYQNWLQKKESLRDAFNHAQKTLKEKEPNPYMWAGFVLVE